MGRKRKPVKRAAKKAARRRNTEEERIDVLCQCGWGRLGCPASELPTQCPICGYAFASEAVEENPGAWACRQCGQPNAWGSTICGSCERAGVVHNPQHCARCGRGELSCQCCGICRRYPCAQTPQCREPLYCGHCRSAPCRDLAECDLWQSTNWDLYRSGRAREGVRPTPLPPLSTAPPSMPTFGPDYEGMILEEDDERWEPNPSHAVWRPCRVCGRDAPPPYYMCGACSTRRNELARCAGCGRETGSSSGLCSACAAPGFTRRNGRTLLPRSTRHWWRRNGI